MYFTLQDLAHANCVNAINTVSMLINVTKTVIFLCEQAQIHKTKFRIIFPKRHLKRRKNHCLHNASTSVFVHLTMTCALWVYTDTISTLLRNINYSAAVSVRKAALLYLPASHSRHHLFVPGGRKFSGRNNDQIEAGLWRQESKNSSRWIEGIDNDSAFRQGSEINHRWGKRGWRKKKKLRQTFLPILIFLAWTDCWAQ